MVLGDFIIKPVDITDAVVYVLDVPGIVDVTEIVVRPNERFEF
jgi:NADP-dependent 3-hydroxy acid dehydrogenase YdfG